MSEKIFPTVLIIISAAAAVPYTFNGDWRHAGYWLCAATLNFCVTY